MAKIIDKIRKTAEDLYNIRQEIDRVEFESKQKLDVLKEQRQALQSVLVNDFNKNGLDSIKISNGDTVYKGKKKSVEIKSPVFALKWAIEHRYVTVDKRLVAQHISKTNEVPDAFEVVESEFISVRKPKKKNADTE